MAHFLGQPAVAITITRHKRR